jgi:hypothetical protein
LFSIHGVRWSSLNRLLYRDPVCHTVLGLMHNWIEGILQHHARKNWGIGVPSSNKSETQEKDTTIPSPSQTDNFDMDVDFDMLYDELNDLQAESLQCKDTPSHLKRFHSQESDQVSHDGSSGSPDEDFWPDSESDSDDENIDENIDDEKEKVKCIFDATTMSKIHACISNVVIPSWIARPPVNLGEKSHGKLKADNWLTLFTIFLPLVLPEIWLASTSKHHEALLDNFYDLVTCTNLVCSHIVSSASADKYLNQYIKYRLSSRHLFPNINTRPNHHYAMHNADLMKFWGPLIKISEFAYERHNGTLQRIKTNAHIWELDFTMLRQICRRGRLTAFIQGCMTLENPLSKALQILFPETHVEKELAQMPPLAEAHHNAQGINLPIHVYNLILEHMNTLSLSSPIRHFKNLPHPMEAYVLP